MSENYVFIYFLTCPGDQQVNILVILGASADQLNA